MKNFASALGLLVVTTLLPLSSIAQEPLPADVNPGSRNRLPALGADSAQGVEGIMRHGSGVDVRFEPAFGRALSELAILIVAREHDQPYEWSLHETEALAVGLDPQVINVVRNRGTLTGLDEREAIIVQIGRELFGEHTLSAETYARAVGEFGETNLVDIVSLMGNYVATALRLTAFNQQMPPGWAQFLPLPFTPPDDILPDTRSRLPRIAPRPRSQAAEPVLYSRGLAPAGTGPGQIRGHGAGQAALERNVGRRTMDLAVLVTARARDAQYLWTTTELAAATHGLEPAVIDVVRYGRPTTGLAEKDAILIDFGRELFGAHTVSAATYARARELFGQSDLVDLIDLMARSAERATLLAAFDQHLPAGQAPLLPRR